MTALHEPSKSKRSISRRITVVRLPLDEILNEDCVAGMRRFLEGSIDLAFADPPFNIGYDYDVYDDRKRREDYLAWCGQWIGEVHRVLKPDGTFWLAIGDEYAAELKVCASARDRIHMPQLGCVVLHVRRELHARSSAVRTLTCSTS